MFVFVELKQIGWRKVLCQFSISPPSLEADSAIIPYGVVGRCNILSSFMKERDTQFVARFGCGLVSGKCTCEINVPCVSAWDQSMACPYSDLVVRERTRSDILARTILYWNMQTRREFIWSK